MPDSIYLDHAATTPVRPEVLDAMLPFFGPRFGNPSSVHRWGRDARVALDEARERVARCIGAQPDEVSFVSGGTEADNLAILGAWHSRHNGRTAIVTTPIEHKAILGAVHQAAKEGATERFFTIDRNGLVSDADFTDQLKPDVALCSIMWVNNEVGTMQPIPALAGQAHERGIVFHTDAVQAFCTVSIDAATQPFDLLTISGHKVGAPKGIGALFVRRGTQIEPLLHGGAQDRGRRPGTENVAYAVGFATAAELVVAERTAEGQRLTRLRDALEAALVARIPDIVIHARNAPRAPHICMVSVPGTDSESLLMALDLAGVAASAGSACQSGSVDPSHVLTALGCPFDVAAGGVRLSLGALTTEASIERVAEIFPALVAKARRLSAAGH
jgi:cysteine desulfurase